MHGGQGTADGQLYFPDDVNAFRVVKFSSTGTLLKRWGSSGRANGQFRFPQGVAVDTAGNIFVSDTGNNRIQKFGR